VNARLAPRRRILLAVGLLAVAFVVLLAGNRASWTLTVALAYAVAALAILVVGNLRRRTEQREDRSRRPAEFVLSGHRFAAVDLP
jgi:membrane protein implicated in regulation of membrane protease activity